MLEVGSVGWFRDRWTFRLSRNQVREEIKRGCNEVLQNVDRRLLSCPCLKMLGIWNTIRLSLWPCLFAEKMPRRATEQEWYYILCDTDGVICSRFLKCSEEARSQQGHESLQEFESSEWNASCIKLTRMPLLRCGTNLLRKFTWTAIDSLVCLNFGISEWEVKVI